MTSWEGWGWVGEGEGVKLWMCFWFIRNYIECDGSDSNQKLWTEWFEKYDDDNSREIAKYSHMYNIKRKPRRKQNVGNVREQERAREKEKKEIEKNEWYFLIITCGNVMPTIAFTPYFRIHRRLPISYHKTCNPHFSQMDRNAYTHPGKNARNTNSHLKDILGSVYYVLMQSAYRLFYREKKINIYCIYGCMYMNTRAHTHTLLRLL